MLNQSVNVEMMSMSKSTLSRKLKKAQNMDYTNKSKIMKSYHGLDKFFLWQDSEMDKSDIQKKNEQLTYAGMQIKASNYKEPDFKVDYTLKVPDALKNKVNR